MKLSTTALQKSTGSKAVVRGPYVLTGTLPAVVPLRCPWDRNGEIKGSVRKTSLCEIFNQNEEEPVSPLLESPHPRMES